MKGQNRSLFSIWVLSLLLLFVIVGCGDADFEDELAPVAAEPAQVEAVEDVPVEAEDAGEVTESQIVEEPEPIEATPASEATDALARGDLSDFYVHPSGAFGLIPFSDDYEEDEGYAAFYGEEAVVFVLFAEGQNVLDEDTVFELAEVALNALPIDEGFARDFGMFDEVEEFNDGYVSYFYYESDFGEGEGDIYLAQAEELTYALVLFTDDYETSEEQWYATLASFTMEETAVVSSEPDDGTDAEPVGEEAADSSSEVADSSNGSEYTVDSGFRPEVNGFSFENYGDNVTAVNLTPTELQRMFGDSVCASNANGSCILTPPAKRWMEQANGYMAGGHCEGMAVLSSLMYFGESDPSDFGGDIAHELAFQNELLQREIAYWFITQGTYPGGVQKVYESPTAVVNALIAAFEQGLNADEWWALGIYQPDFSGGHAITPFAVEDMGDDVYHIMVYDNNWPGESRFVMVDTNSDTWEYQAATNPNEPSELYKGDADTQTLEIVAISPRLQQQECSFCADSGSAQIRGAGLAAVQAAAAYNEIWLEGETDLLIIDEAGRRLGFVDGEFVNEIPGSVGANYRLLQGINVWEADSEPVYQIPLGIQFSITIDASRLTQPTTSTVTMIGPGYNLVVEDVYLDPGTQDVITVSPDGSELSYQTEYNDAPDMIFGVETPAADYEFIIAALDIEAGAEFFVKLDIDQGNLSINTRNMTEFGTYEIVMYRIDDEGEQWFSNDDIYLEPQDTAYFNFLEWEGPGSSMFIDIDYLTDGTIDERIELFDEFGTDG